MSRCMCWCFRGTTLMGLIAAVLCFGNDERPAEAAAIAGAADGPAAHTFVGTLAGAADSARIGIVCDDKNFLVYVCSQDAAFNADHAAWFKGARNGDSLAATNGARNFKAAITAERAAGEITSGGKTFTFTAKNCDNHVVAGLYRAEDTDDNQKCVFGWVVDEDGTVAGGLQRQNVKGTRVIPNNGVLNGLNGQVNPKVQPVNGQRVQNPALPPVGVKGKKFTGARRQEFLNRLAASSPRNGNPLMGGLVHMVRRFIAGQRPQGEVEQAVFARLQRVPRQALADYLKNWDALPAAFRERLTGTDLKGIAINQPITKEIARGLGTRSGVSVRSAPPPAPAAGAPVISQVTIRELKCIKTTSSAGEGRDEIFAVYAVAAGNQLFAKTTGVINKIKNGDANDFTAADQIVFPPAEQPAITSAEDVIIVAKLFESDGNIDLIKNVIKALVDAGIVTIAILTAPAGAAAGGFVVPANLLIDQIAAGIPDAQPLEEDDVRAGVDGRTRRVETNTIKNEMEFRRNDKAGPAPFRYELRKFDVRVKN